MLLKQNSTLNEALADQRLHSISEIEALSSEIPRLKQEQQAGAEERRRFASDLEQNNQTLASTRKAAGEQQAAFAALKVDLLNGVQAAFTKEIVNTAANLSVKNLLQDKAVLLGGTFVRAVAKTLVTDYAPELRGLPGADADNTVVAKLLTADPEFLNRVSVSALTVSQ